MSSCIAAPAAHPAHSTVVAELYKAFAWQAIASARGPFGKPLVEQDRHTLRRYFDPSLATLLLKDRRCVTRTGEVCNLDFDPIFVSQDPSAADLSIEAVDNGVVNVEFVYPPNRQRVQLQYKVVRNGKFWRIHDIRYPGMQQQTLKQLLMRELP